MIKEILYLYTIERSAIALDLPLAPYGWSVLKDSLHFTWMAYGMFLGEHASELSNSINELRQLIRSLLAWKSVLEQLDEDKKHHAIIEFVAPLATVALNLPYVIRSRYVYSVAHLSHQANQLKITPWVDNLPIDEDIYFETADQYGKYWKKYKKLKLELEKIANKRFQSATYDFRNKYNHRYSPRIEIGITGLVNREVNNKGQVSYSIGQTEPLLLNSIIPLLIEQHSNCFSAYEKYQELINEQVSEIHHT